MTAESDKLREERKAFEAWLDSPCDASENPVPWVNYTGGDMKLLLWQAWQAARRADDTCPKGDDCDLTAAYMAGAASRADDALLRRIEHYICQVVAANRLMKPQHLLDDIRAAIKESRRD